MVFGPMVLDHGISSEVLKQGIWTQVLALSGFRPWYWVMPKTIKGEGDHLEKASTQGLNILWRARSRILVIGLWCIDDLNPGGTWALEEG